MMRPRAEGSQSMSKPHTSLQQLSGFHRQNLNERIIADALMENMRSTIQAPRRFTAQPETARLRNGTLLAKSPMVLRVCCGGAYLAASFNPACSARAAALSVASQVNSGSVRPKWP